MRLVAPWRRPGWKYVAPVLVAPRSWPPRARYVLVDANLVLNAVLPTWVLRRLDGRAGSRAYWRRIRRAEARDYDPEVRW